MEIKRLFGKPKTYKIAGQEMELKPLTLGDSDILVLLEDDKKRGDAIKELVKKTLKKSYPDMSDEDIDQISFDNVLELQKAILDVNGMPVPDELK